MEKQYVISEKQFDDALAASCGNAYKLVKLLFPHLISSEEVEFTFLGKTLISKSTKFEDILPWLTKDAKLHFTKIRLDQGWE